jgi:hypothetical protein
MKLKIERFEPKKIVLLYNDEYYGIFKYITNENI